MERKIPKLSSPLLLPIRRKDSETSEDEYLFFIVSMERKFQDYMLNVLSHLGFHASVKSERTSLPYTHELKHVTFGSSYVNAAYAFNEPARKFVKELLNSGTRKIRFYAMIDVEEGGILNFGKVVFTFRYYELKKT